MSYKVLENGDVEEIGEALVTIKTPEQIDIEIKVYQETIANMQAEIAKLQAKIAEITPISVEAKATKGALKVE